MNTQCIILLTMALAWICPGVLSADEKETAETQLAGEWVAEKVLSAGREVPPEKFPFELVFAANKLTFKGVTVGAITGKDRVHDLVLDPSAKPAAMDLTRTIRDQKQMVYAIYKIEDNRLMICFFRDAKDATQRPTKFESTAATPADLLILRRKPKQNE